MANRSRPYKPRSERNNGKLQTFLLVSAAAMLCIHRLKSIAKYLSISDRKVIVVQVCCLQVLVLSVAAAISQPLLSFSFLVSFGGHAFWRFIGFGCSRKSAPGAYTCIGEDNVV